MDYDVLIIGGGAAGLACAVRLCKNGICNIAVVDLVSRFGKKLASTGNGQGNISNNNISAANYHGGGKSLAAKIACLDPFAGSKLFDCLFESDGRGRIYPAGRQASALTDNLLAKLNQSGANLFSGMRAEKIIPVKGGYAVKCGEKEFSARYIVLCTGGKAARQFGTDGSSYKLALDLGHTLTPLYPSLVQLKCETAPIKGWKGIRVNCALSALCNGQVLATERGDIIFTDYGISGNAVFAISSRIVGKSGVSVFIDFLPDFSEKVILENLRARSSNGGAVSELLSGTLHNQIGRKIIATAGDNLETIVKNVKNYRLEVIGTLGFDYAQVTRGGICADEVSEKLESKLNPGMFFAGEILDVDGDCGGYNLQWAFTGGICVADEISGRLKNDKTGQR